MFHQHIKQQKYTFLKPMVDSGCHVDIDLTDSIISRIFPHSCWHTLPELWKCFVDHCIVIFYRLSCTHSYVCTSLTASYDHFGILKLFVCVINWSYCIEVN